MSGVIAKRYVLHDSMVRTWVGEGDDVWEAVRIAVPFQDFRILGFV